ncbi:hypothetical protein J7E71_26540 [Mesobacillus foraminis]|nr:hypothetical protein [Mesobacillus foraminis]MBT2759430.1 hypothetical protein [Mesobacillus foraminis]
MNFIKKWAPNVRKLPFWRFYASGPDSLPGHLIEDELADLRCEAAQ